MPRIPTYESQIGIPSTGTIAPMPVGAGALGWDVLDQAGQNMSRVGQELDNRLIRLNQVKQLSDLTIDAHTKLADLRTQLTTSEEFNRDPDAAEARYKQAVGEMTKGYQSQVTDPEVAVHFQEALAKTALSHQLELRNDVRKKKIDITAAAADTALEYWSNYGVSTDPVEAEKQIRSTIAGYTAGELMTNEHGGDLVRKSLLKMGIGIVSRDIHADPEMALLHLQGGGYPQLTDENHRETLMERAERQIELNRNKSERTNSMDRHILQGQMKDSLASARATGQPMDGMDMRIATTFGRDQAPLVMAEYQKELNRNLRLHDLSQEIAFMPSDQAYQRIESIKPVPGSEGYAESYRDYAEMNQELQKRDKLLFDPKSGDPAAYVLSAPEVRDSPPEQQMDKMLALQSNLGIPDYQRRVLTNKQAGDWVTKFNAVPAEERIKMMGKLKKETGQHYDLFFHDLVRQGLAPENQVLNVLHDDPQSAPVLPVVAEAINQGKELKKNLGEKVVKDVEEAVLDNIAPWRSTIMSGDYTGARVCWANEIQSAVTDVALVYAQRGKSANEAGKLAVAQVINHLYHPLHSNSDYRVPVLFNERSIDNFARIAKDNLGSVGRGSVPAAPGDEPTSTFVRHPIPGTPGPAPEMWTTFDPLPHGTAKEGLMPDQIRKDYIDAVKRKGRWITNEDESGLVLIDELNLPVIDRSGKRYEFRFDQAERYHAPDEPSYNPWTPISMGETAPTAEEQKGFSVARIAELFGSATAEASTIKSTGMGERNIPADIREKILSESNKNGVDAELIARIVNAESAFNPKAISSAGARGYMQLMPGTARDLGVNPDDPHQNIEGGVRYFAQQLKDFGNDTQRALVAYNWGPGKARRWNGKLSSLPEETRNYVKKIMGA